MFFNLLFASALLLIAARGQLNRWAASSGFPYGASKNTGHSNSLRWSIRFEPAGDIRWYFETVSWPKHGSVPPSENYEAGEIESNQPYGDRSHRAEDAGEI